MKVKFSVVCFLIFYCLTSAHADTTLVSFGSQWKYFDGGTQPSPQWIDSTFNDSLWLSGNAELGYGDSDENTVVSYGSNASAKYITTYFRKNVEVVNVASYTSIQLNVKRDDGVVVYVNGVEVYRNNMPSGVITDNTLALISVPDDGDVPQTVNVSASLFVEGNNSVAVEIHQESASSSDISFDMEVMAYYVAVPLLLRQPYLLMPSSSGITIRWRTDIPCPSRVCFSPDTSSLTACISDTVFVTDHEVRLSGLNPSTSYFYSIGDGTSVLQSGSSNYFSTAPVAGTSKSTRLWILADTGVNTLDQNNVRDAFLNYNGSLPLDFLLMLGDNAYNSGTDQEYQDAFFQNHYEDIIKKLPVFSTAGNHENYTADALQQTGPYYDIFSLPKNGECGGIASGTEAYYSFDYGKIHFVCLETNTPSLLLPGSDMINWLGTDLAATQQKWKVVFFHNPPYTKGGHDSDVETDLIAIRQNIVPVLEQYKTDLVVCGHGHVYERSYFMDGHYGLSSSFDTTMIVDSSSGLLPQPFLKRTNNNYKGTVYIQAGCSGVVEAVRPDWPHNAMRVVDNVNLGSLMLEVNEDTLTLKFIDSDVASPHVLDEFSIMKKCDVVTSLSPLSKMCLASSPVVLQGLPAGGVYSGAGVNDSIFDPSTAGGGLHTLSYTYTDQSACSVSSSIQVEIVPSVPAIPSAVSGASVVCPPSTGEMLFIAGQPDADSYQWSLASGSAGVSFSGAVNDTSVNFNLTGTYPSYTIDVKAVNVCGAGPVQTKTLSRVKNYTVIPYGSTLACPLDTIAYTTYGLNSLAVYTWSAPSGSLINGQPTPLNTLSVTGVKVVFPATFNSGKVCVANHPACLRNNQVSCINISSAPSRPQAIQGIAAVMPGSSGVAYSVLPVPGATGYQWIVPAEASIVSGQNTPSITVDFSGLYSGGFINVEALSDCDQSSPRSKLVKAFTMMSGNSVHTEARKVVVSGQSSDQVVRFYPNPSHLSISVDLSGIDEGLNYQVDVLDITGKLILNTYGVVSTGEKNRKLDVSSLAKGVYLFKFTAGNIGYYQQVVLE